MDEFDQLLSEAQGQNNDEWHQERIGKFTASRFSDMMKRGQSYKSDYDKVNELRARLAAIETGALKKEIKALEGEIIIKKAAKRGTKRDEDKLKKLNSYSLSETKEELKLALQEYNKSRYGDTCYSYIYEKLGEILTMSPHIVTGQAIEWGNEYEEAALVRYEREKDVDVKRIGFLSFNEYAGGSPDGLVGEDGIIEIKCPYNPKNHAQSLVTQTYYNQDHDWQVQGNLLITDRSWCDFITYDPRVQEGPLQFNCFRVQRDEEKITAIQDRLEEVKEKLTELLEQHNLA